MEIPKCIAVKGGGEKLTIYPSGHNNVVDKLGPTIPSPHGSVTISNIGAIRALYVIEI